MKNNKVIINFSVLSYIFLLILIDCLFLHPYANFVAMAVILIYCFVLGLNYKKDQTK